MIVLAHVAGQGGALVDSDLLRAALVGQNDEGIEANLLGARRGASRSAGANGGARRVGAPPVVRCGNGRTGRRSLVNEIVGPSHLGQVACEAAEADGRRPACRAYKDAAAQPRAPASSSRGVISRDGKLGQCGALARVAAIDPNASTGPPGRSTIDHRALIAAERGSGIDSATLTSRLVTGDGAAMNG